MMRPYRYYDFVMAGFVTVLLCSNIIGAAKVASIGGFVFGAGVFFFPFSYIFGDVLTEVYGYAKTRRVVWAGFAALAFASLMSITIVALPPAPDWGNQEAYATIFGQTPRIALASLVAYWAGEFANSFVMARMKVMMNGRSLWMRTIGSTIVGQAVDSLIFYPVAFYGVWVNRDLLFVMISNYFIKVGWEAVITPFTYMVVNFLKKKENEDYYDINTDFSPFTLKD
jgi:uncharacterized integral membrane protein (TIGR00697 family)